MSRQLPSDPAPASSASDDGEWILAALDAASREPSLPAHTRQLLCSAANALRSASADVEHAQMRYQALFHAVPDPVSVIADDGTVLDLNKAGMEAYRRPRHEIIGQPIHVLNPDLPEDHMAPVLEALARGET